MTEKQKLIAELAARFMEARIKCTGHTKDTAYAVQCVNQAKCIVEVAAAS